MIRFTILLTLLFFQQQIYSQEVTLEHFLSMALNNSSLVQKMKNSIIIENKKLEQKQSIYLPTLQTKISAPSYSKSISPVQQENGEYKFYEVENLNTSAGITISQNLPFGSSLGLNSRLSHYSSLKTDYYTGSINLNFSQKLSFINDAGNILINSQLLYSYNNIKLLRTLQNYQNKIKDIFFSAIIKKDQIEINKNEITSLKNLLKKISAKVKYDPSLKLDSLSISIRINKLLHENSHNIKQLASIKEQLLYISKKKEIDLNNLVVGIKISEVKYDFSILWSNYHNNIFKHEKKLEIFPLKLDIKKKKYKTLESSILNFSVGINNNDPRVKYLTDNYKSSFSFNVNLSLPIFDWGIARKELEISKKNLDNVLIDFEDKIFNTKESINNLLNEREWMIESLRLNNQEIDVNYLLLSRAKRYYNDGKYDINKIFEVHIRIKELLTKKNQIIQKLWSNHFKITYYTLFDPLKNSKINL